MHPIKSEPAFYLLFGFFPPFGCFLFDLLSGRLELSGCFLLQMVDFLLDRGKIDGVVPSLEVKILPPVARLLDGGAGEFECFLGDFGRGS